MGVCAPVDLRLTDGQERVLAVATDLPGRLAGTRDWCVGGVSCRAARPAPGANPQRTPVPHVNQGLAECHVLRCVSFA